MPTKPLLKPLGKDGPLIPAMGFGLMGLGGHAKYGGPQLTEEEVFALLDRALELGETHWDTSDLYGTCEELVGKWFKRTGKRDQIFLATKFGYVKGSSVLEINTSFDYTKKACDESLKVLGVDTIDLYYAHNVNPETPIEETMRALLELKKEGKIKHIGISAMSAGTLRRAVKVGPVAAAQYEYSVLSRDVEGPAGQNLLATCRELGIASVILTPLGRGLLTTSFSSPADAIEGDMRSYMSPRFQGENLEANIKAVAQFKVFADKKGCSVTQLALAWLLKRGDDIFPIPGTRKIKYLEENWASQDIVLTDAEEAEIDSLAEANGFAGEMAPPQYAHLLYRDTKEE
ncbi:putative aldo-keto reductase [Xylariomycetidae sp. FL2044]|nr:putative aldo-keto reductase [Xylariomycetidae sp. FL2044]